MKTGRPNLSEDNKGESDLIAIKIPPSLHKAIKAEMKARGQTKSELVREALISWLEVAS
jgi:predicted DNA-binding protein